MTYRLSRRVRRLILASLITTTTSLGFSHAGAESPDVPAPTDGAPDPITKAEHPDPTEPGDAATPDSEPCAENPCAAEPAVQDPAIAGSRITRTCSSFDQSVAAVAGSAYAGVGTSLWQWVESFAMVEPARTVSSSEHGSQTPPDWDSRDDDTFDVVTLDDLLHRDLEELPTEASADQQQQLAADQDPEPEKPCAAVGGSPMIITLVETPAGLDEEYCPYDLETPHRVDTETLPTTAGGSDVLRDLGRIHVRTALAKLREQIDPILLAGTAELLKVDSERELKSQRRAELPTLEWMPRFDRPLDAPGTPFAIDWSPRRGDGAETASEETVPDTVVPLAPNTGQWAQQEDAPRGDEPNWEQLAEADELLDTLVQRLTSQSARFAQVSDSMRPEVWGPKLLALSRQGAQALQTAAEAIAGGSRPAATAEPAIEKAGERLLARADAVAADAAAADDLEPEADEDESAVAESGSEGEGNVEAADDMTVDAETLAEAVERLQEWWSTAEAFRQRLGRVANLPGDPSQAADPSRVR